MKTILTFLRLFVPWLDRIDGLEYQVNFWRDKYYEESFARTVENWKHWDRLNKAQWDHIIEVRDLVANIGA
jgi:hypothetical protein